MNAPGAADAEPAELPAAASSASSEPPVRKRHLRQRIWVSWRGSALPCRGGTQRGDACARGAGQAGGQRAAGRRAHGVAGAVQPPAPRPHDRRACGLASLPVAAKTAGQAVRGRVRGARGGAWQDSSAARGVRRLAVDRPLPFAQRREKQTADDTDELEDEAAAKPAGMRSPCGRLSASLCPPSAAPCRSVKSRHGGAMQRASRHPARRRC